MTPKRAVVLLATAGIALVSAGCGATSVPPSSFGPRASASATTAGSPGSLVYDTAASTGSTVTAEGVGTVSGEPDTLTVEIGVSTTGLHAADALDQNNTLAAAVQSALQAHGVAAADIATSNLSLQQNWGAHGPSGYAAEDDVTATVHHLAQAGALIDAALTPAGDAGRLDEVQFSFSNSDPLLAAARQQAVVAAREQAGQMASSAGDHIGALVSLSDTTTSASNPVVFAGNAAASASAPVPLQAGTQQMSVDVTGVWQVLPGVS